MKLKKKRLVMVEWEDSQSDNGWTHDKPELKAPIVKTVGWLLRRNRKMIILAASITQEKDFQHTERMTIPCCCVRNVVRLGKKNLNV